MVVVCELSGYMYFNKMWLKDEILKKRQSFWHHLQTSDRNYSYVRICLFSEFVEGHIVFRNKYVET